MNRNFDPEAFTLLGLGIGVIAFRFTSRLIALGVRNLRVDDYLMLLVAALYVGHTVLAHYVGVFGKGLTNAAMSDVEREELSHFLDSKEYTDRVWGSKVQLLVWIIYTTLLWILKTCMLFFYLRLTENVETMRRKIQLGFFILPATYIVMILVELFGCHPFQKHWQIYPDPGEVCYPSHSMPNLYSMIILNVTTDLYLMFIPLPMIWKSGLPLKVKLSLNLLFSAGILVTTIAFLCCFFIITAGPTGAARAGQWSVRESFLAILITNTPLIFPFACRFLTHISSRSKKHAYRLSSSPTPSPGVSFGSLGKKRVRSPYSIPGESVWDGEQDWQGGDTVGFWPGNRTDVETGSSTCKEKGVVVVRTEVGVECSEGLPAKA